MPTHIVGEGAIDRVVIRSLHIVPPDAVYPASGGHQGRDDTMRFAHDLALIIGGTTIVLVLDLDTRPAARLREELVASHNDWERVGAAPDAYVYLRGHR